MNYRVLVKPQTEPVSLVQAKAHLYISHSDSDAEILAMIAAARQHVEKIVDFALMPQTLRLAIPAFATPICLPGGRVQSIVQVAYTDAAGAQQVLAGAVLDAEPIPALLTPPPTGWPATYAASSAVRIDYVAGFADADDVPGDIRSAIKLLVGDMFENREAGGTAGAFARNPTVDAILASYRMGGL